MMYKTAEPQPASRLHQQWHNKLGMSPPALKQLNEDDLVVRTFLTIETVEERLKADGYDEFIVQDTTTDATLDQKILYYLYATEYMWSCESATKKAKFQCKKNRKKKIQIFLNDPGAHERMQDILKTETDQALDTPEAQEFWSKHQRWILRYRAHANTSTIFDQVFPYVARRQLSSRDSYLHAVGTFLGYKHMFDNDTALREQGLERKAVSVDVSKLIRHYYLHHPQLEKRVLDNKGGSPIEVVFRWIRHVPQQQLLPCHIGDSRGVENVVYIYWRITARS